MTVRDQLFDLLNNQLGETTFDCTRDWSAWGYGTMREDDFTPTTYRLHDIVDAILNLAASASVKGNAP